MNVLLLMQSINQHYVDTIIQALPEDSVAYVFTGSEISVDAPHHIIHTKPYVSASMLKRASCWIAFVHDVNVWLKRNSALKIDFVYAVSNPPLNSFLGVRIKKKYGSKFIYMEWDIYPQIIEKTNSSLPIKLLCISWHHLNRTILPQIDCMLTIGECMRKSICAPLKQDINIRVQNIYTDVEKMVPRRKEENWFIHENNLSSKFIVIYSGKMGLGHNIPLILDAAKILEDKNKNIVFLMIGHGVGYKMTEERIIAGAKNIVLLPKQSEDVFPYSMASGDVGIVSQEAKLSDLFMPSKAYDMLACGTPIIGICTENDDLYNLISGIGVGKTITNQNAQSVADTILYYYDNPEILKREKEKSREVAEIDYSKDKALENYKKLFKEILIKGV